MISFSPSELNVVGSYKVYPSLKQVFGAMGFPVPDAEPKFNRPITPKENFKLSLDGKTPYWLPYGGMAFCDIQSFEPRQIPDNFATRLVMDGGDECDYPSLIQRSSWFDLDWEYVPVAGGATVHPGEPKVPNISEWEKYVKMPDLDEIDWDSMERENVEYLATDKLNILHILSGPWERLMSLLDVENAAISLIDEDMQEGIHRFLDQYCNIMDELIGRVAERCDLDGILLHDDWGHQNGPFFSIGTAEEMFLPYLKRIVESCHKRGLYYEQHSCGKNETFVDLYIKAGVNLYCPQDINDFDIMLEKCKGSQLVIVLPAPMIAPDTPEYEIRKIAEEWFEKYKEYNVALSGLGANPVFNTVIYELSRIEYQKRQKIN